jgi:hypothetical protein
MKKLDLGVDERIILKLSNRGRCDGLGVDGRIILKLSNRGRCDGTNMTGKHEQTRPGSRRKDNIKIIKSRKM